MVETLFSEAKADLNRVYVPEKTSAPPRAFSSD
jgi:hypothetical protein